MSQYIRHLTGMAALLSWVARWDRRPSVLDRSAIERRGPWILVEGLPSQRVVLGLPRHRRYGRHPFLGFQQDERAWASRLVFARAVAVPSENRLALVTRPIQADASLDEVDLPALAVVLTFDAPEKLEAAQATGVLEGRGLWWDEDGSVQVDRTAHVFRLPVKVASCLDETLTASETAAHRTFADVVARRIDRTNRFENPGYRGERNAVEPSLRWMLEPFDASRVPRVEGEA